LFFLTKGNACSQKQEHHDEFEFHSFNFGLKGNESRRVRQVVKGGLVL
jgi:hypothetical protein